MVQVSFVQLKKYLTFLQKNMQSSWVVFILLDIMQLKYYNVKNNTSYVI